MRLHPGGHIGPPLQGLYGQKKETIRCGSHLDSPYSLSV